MVKITDIAPGSIAEELGLQPGNFILKINNKSVNDRLDYRFYVSEELVELLVKQDSEEILFEIEKDIDDMLGISLEEMKLKACGNNCVFCFVYQNPKGMRKPLYFKDEDYRFSFMYGHYVTMTTLKQNDLDRIVEQRLSPLYISVHSTEPETRKLLLGIKFDDRLLEKIEFLTSNGIELHAQIVLCPDINDGAIFRQTVDDLKKFYPAIRSVAVVPLGLTRYRDNLLPMRMHTIPELQQTVAFINEYRLELQTELGDPFVYPADEFFIKAQLPIPDETYYGEFYQIENGVGEFRDMIDWFNKERKEVLDPKIDSTTITWVTGKLAYGTLDEFIVNPLRQLKNLKIELVGIENNFYGPSIQVSGLLVGEDIYNQLKGRELGNMVLLPPRVLNEDNLFLDDWTVGQLEEKLGRPVHVYKESLSELPQVISKLHQRKLA